MPTVAAKGELVSGAGCTGVIRQANTVADVLQLLKDPDLGSVIIFTESPSATAVVPLLAKARGVVCQSGGMTSHLAIVSREFGLPCVMGAECADPGALEGQEVTLTPEGAVLLA